MMALIPEIEVLRHLPRGNHGEKSSAGRLASRTLRRPRCGDGRIGRTPGWAHAASHGGRGGCRRPPIYDRGRTGHLLPARHYRDVDHEPHRASVGLVVWADRSRAPSTLLVGIGLGILVLVSPDRGPDAERPS